MAISELVMPKMGESIMEATILRWHKKVGDFVKMDETLLDIATDKVDSEVPSTAQGIITELLYSVNDVVPVGAVLCKIETEVHAAVATPAPVVFEPAAVVEHIAEPVAFATPEPVYHEPVFAAPPPPPQEFIPFVPPSNEPVVISNNRFFSPLVLNIANSEGLSLSELERIPGTGADGRVSKKDVLQYIADKRAGKVPVFNPTPAAQPQQYYTAPSTPVFPVSVPQQEQTPIENTLSVAVEENKAEEIVHHKQDIGFYPIAETPIVEEFIPPSVENKMEEPVVVEEAPAVVEEAPVVVAAPVTPAPKVVAEPPAFDASKYKNAEIVEMDRMRKLIAKHMVDSKATSPHVTSFTEADVTNMVTWRSKIKGEFEKREGMKITFTPMFIECILKVMKHYPIINSSVVGDKIIMKRDFNIGMATALPSGNLIVPVIKNAADMNFINLTRSVNTLADNARQGKLSPDDVMDGTFTFTNVGTFGSLMGTPIINQPQVAILAVGEIKKRPVVVETDKGDFIGIRHMMYLSLSYDHRIIDGSIGASFLSDIAKELEAWDVNRQLKYVVKEWYVE